jgi:hypothetical protein
MRPYTYARSENGTRRTLLYLELASALYTAILDVAQQRAVPIGIRQGRRILYRHSQLVALHARYAEQLATGEHWAVVQALETVTSPPLPDAGAA